MKNILALTLSAVVFTTTASTAFADTSIVTANQSNMAGFTFSVLAQAVDDQADVETSVLLHTGKGSRGHRGHRDHRGHGYRGNRSYRNHGYRSYRGTARTATTHDKDLRREVHDLKEVVAEQTLELRLLKKSMLRDGGDQE